MSTGKLDVLVVDQGAWCVLHKPLDIQKLFGLVGTIKPGGIMIVDDDPDFLASIETVLSDDGYPCSRIYLFP